MKIKNFKTILFSCLIFGLAYFFLSFFYFEKEISFDNQEKQEDFNNSEISIFFVGDIMLDRGVEYMVNKEGKKDFRFSFLKIADELKKSDILFGNLEGPISDNGLKVGSIYSFRFKPEAINGLLYADFDILSLANNHMLDYQRIALEDTMKILKENNIDYVGAGLNKEEAFSLKIKQVKDTRIGFLAYTNLGTKNWQAGNENSGMAWINENDITEVIEYIKKAKEEVDVLIISLHAGEEYAENPTNFQISFAQDCISSGADLVIGHHPHVVQRIEQYKDGWIAYSLGNFVFDQHFSKETMESIILKVVIEDKKINKVYSENIRINEYFQPELTIEN
jgi:poly-gamma-glutamate synthesis protein (capsule biosynthesis protein)